MGCTNPMLRFKDGQVTNLRAYLKKADEHKVLEGIKKGELSLLSCGDCTGCRLSYANRWAAKCYLESLYHYNTHFATLTYDDAHIPILNKDTAEIRNGKGVIFNPEVEKETLFPRDLQLFWKRLRRAMERKGIYNTDGDFKYFSAGEYGGKTMRPHYHAVIFGMRLEDPDDIEQLYRRNGVVHFTSKWLSEIWGNGFVDLAASNYEAARYVAQYSLKKHRTRQEKLEMQKLGYIPECTFKSNRGGAIGAEYYQDHKDEIYAQDYIIIPSKNRSLKVKPPHQYDVMFDREHGGHTEYDDAEDKNIKVESEEMQEIKRKRRQIANDNLWEELKGTELSWIEYLKNQEEKAKNPRYERLPKARS